MSDGWPHVRLIYTNQQNACKPHFEFGGLELLQHVDDDAEVAWDRDCADVTPHPSKHGALRVSLNHNGTAVAFSGPPGYSVATWSTIERRWVPR